MPTPQETFDEAALALGAEGANRTIYGHAEDSVGYCPSCLGQFGCESDCVTSNFDRAYRALIESR